MVLEARRTAARDADVDPPDVPAANVGADVARRRRRPAVPEHHDVDAVRCVGNLAGAGEPAATWNNPTIARAPSRAERAYGGARRRRRIGDRQSGGAVRFPREIQHAEHTHADVAGAHDLSAGNSARPSLLTMFAATTGTFASSHRRAISAPRASSRSPTVIASIPMRR